MPVQYGQWAVVTGSTDGIGLAQACELARRGMDVYLLSRSDDKLTQAAVKVSRPSFVPQPST